MDRTTDRSNPVEGARASAQQYQERRRKQQRNDSVDQARQRANPSTIVINPKPMSNKSKPNGPEKMKAKTYEKELRKLQAHLCQLQDWVKAKGLRVIIVFEGRDAAGKGGTIRALTERVSPRIFRVVALPAPSDREKSQMYMQRYMRYFPAAGEIVIFDRSWYNRAGVEYVMGFCTKEQHRPFPRAVPAYRGIHSRRWHSAHQNLAGSKRQGTKTPLRGADRRSNSPVETQPDGSSLAQQVV